MSEHDEQMNDRLQEKIELAAKTLGEDFDSLLILATSDAVGHTVYFQASSGSGAACRGSVVSYYEREKGFDRASGAKKYADFHEND